MAASGRTAVAACCAAAVLELAACGSKDQPAHLSDLAPPDTGAYVEAAVRPTGQEGARLRQVIAAFTARPVDEDSIAPALFESSGIGGSDLSFRDLAPWLGRRAAMFITARGARGLEVVIAFDSINEKASERFIRKFAGRGAARRREGDHRFLHTEGGGAIGALEGRVVLATSDVAYRRSVAAADGRSLSDDAAYKRAAIAGPQPVASLYVHDRESLLRVAERVKTTTRAERAAMVQLLPRRGATSAVLFARPHGLDATFYLPAERGDDQPVPTLGFAGRKSWLAIASRRLGAWVRDRLAPDGPIPVDPAAVGGEDVLGGLLDGIRRGVLELEGGQTGPLRISADAKVANPSRMRRLLVKLASAVDRRPGIEAVVKKSRYFDGDVTVRIGAERRPRLEPMFFTLAGSKLTIQQGGTGPDDGQLSSAPGFKSAAATLKGKPTFYFDFQAAMSFMAVVRGRSPSTYRRQAPQISYIAARDEIRGRRRIYRMTLEVTGRRPERNLADPGAKSTPSQA